MRVGLLPLGMMMLLLPCAALADCSSTCSGGTCLFDGIRNYPLGAASLSLTAECHLRVDGIGSSGFDGVVQDSLGSTYMVTTLGTPNFSGSILGTRAAIRQVGVVDGEDGHEISLTRVTNVDGANVELIMDCGAILVREYIVEIYDGGQLVEERVLHGNAIPYLRFGKVDLEAMACAILGNGDVYTTVRLGNAVPIYIREGSFVGPFVGSCVRMWGRRPVRVPSLQEAIENRFIDSGPVILTSVFAGALPDTDRVCPEASVVAVTEEVPATSARVTLQPIWPNPMRGQGRITYMTEGVHGRRLRLCVRDAAGREVCRLADEPVRDGSHQLLWSGTDAGGRKVPSGLYFIELRVGDMTVRQKTLILR
jgi:hypothetical protein